MERCGSTHFLAVSSHHSTANLHPGLVSEYAQGNMHMLVAIALNWCHPWCLKVEECLLNRLRQWAALEAPLLIVSFMCNHVVAPPRRGRPVQKWVFSLQVSNWFEAINSKLHSCPRYGTSSLQTVGWPYMGGYHIALVMFTFRAMLSVAWGLHCTPPHAISANPTLQSPQCARLSAHSLYNSSVYSE